LKKTYISKNWDVELITFSTADLNKIKYGREIPIFYAKASRIKRGGGGEREEKYHKYYFDARTKVADKLKIPLTVKSVNELRTTMLSPTAIETNMALMDTFTGPFWPEEV
jgi:hypothetical protein